MFRDSDYLRFKDLMKNVQSPEFKALVIFGSQRKLNEWRIHFGTTVETLGGKYTPGLMLWNFPWGAQLKLEVISNNHDISKIRGVNFTDVEYDTWSGIEEPFLSTLRGVLRK